MQTAIINTPEITPANTKATIEASHFVSQFGCTVALWTKGDITRVYINKGRNTSYGYVEFRDTSVTANASSRLQLEQITEVLAGELIAPVAPVRKVSNTTVEEFRADGWSPYGDNNEYANARQLSRRIAAEGGDNY